MNNQTNALKERLEKIIRLMFSVVRDPSVSFRFWDDSELSFHKTEQPKLRVILKNPEAILNLVFRPNDLALTEAYFLDNFDLEGDLYEAVRIGEQLATYKWSKTEIASLAGSALSLGFSALITKANSAYRGKGKLHSINRDKEAIAYHYDTSNEFFGLWLDSRMVYSGAYFPSLDATLEEAQLNKLDCVCKKLMLQKGEKFLDIGCGWGALVMHAAEHYGVKAKGISLSMKQVEYANQKIRERGLQDTCEVLYADYRELPEGEKYDKIASVEMLHHVGSEMLQEYFRKIRAHLTPEGLSFQLTVSSVPARIIRKSPEFIDRYFQPDFHLQPISTIIGEAEKAGFELYDVENVREHYRLTAKHWLARLENAHDPIVKEVNEFTFRVMRLGLFMLMIGFESGEAGFYHFVLMNKKTSCGKMPLTRKEYLGM
ncbi:MAG: class I SAM-dependent methyltransferase [Ignavibacteriales bacterium]|nr:class I SAM-dependent methyltransferase [Ignavibacteriales bacterium]